MGTTMEDIWRKITAFHENRIVTSGALHKGEQEIQFVNDFLNEVPIEALFQCLQVASDANDRGKVSIICKCIERVFSSNKAIFFQPENSQFLLGGLSHSEAQARILTINLLLMQVVDQQDVETIANRDLVAALCELVKFDDLDVAGKAGTMIERMTSYPTSDVQKLVLDVLRAIVASDSIDESSVEYMRYLEIIADICQQNSTNMKYAIDTKAVEPILSCLSSNDPLFIMNVIDLIPKLCNSSLGVQYIYDHGTLEKLLKMSEDPFVGDNALRLVGEVLAASEQFNLKLWNSRDPILARTFLAPISNKLQNSDTLHQIAAMDALASYAASSVEELTFLLNNKELCKTWLDLRLSTKIPVKVNCYHSISRVLAEPTYLIKEKEDIAPKEDKIWNLNEQLFRHLSAKRNSTSTALDEVMKALKQPFDDIRIAIFKLLRAIAAQGNPWGYQTLFEYGGFIDFLLDRATEPTKECREWKFAIVDALLASPFQSTMNPDIIMKLKTHLKAGPYVGKQTQELSLDAM